MFAEHGDDLVGLPCPHQPMVDEHAGQLVADRLVDQHRGHRGIDAARQAADHLAVAHLCADLGDLGGAELGHGPVARQAADMAHEVRQQLGAVGGVDHLRVELHRIIAALVIGDHRIGRTAARGDGAEAGGELGDMVAMAHPHLVALALAPQPVEQRTLVGDLNECLAELPGHSPLDPPAELEVHRLLAVADAEQR